MLKLNFVFLSGILLISMFSCGSDQQVKENQEMDLIAEQYVKLVLTIGLYDADYVDAYYGPEEWRLGLADGDADARKAGL